MAKSKKNKFEDEEPSVRRTTVKTEIQTSLDDLDRELLDKKNKFDPALQVIQGDLMGRVFKLKEGNTIIGRHPTCDINLKDRKISSRHVELRNSGSSVILEDLKSANGTILNNSKTVKPMTLVQGDIIKLATFAFKYIDNSLESHLAEYLHNQGSTDPLTGVFNKGYVMKALNSSIEIAKGGYPLSLIMIDLDHFKKVNDTYGHLAGDYVLKDTCRVIKDIVLRQEDVLGRFGGEEFVVILPDMNVKNAMGVAERIRTSIQVNQYVWEDQKIQVTASLGVSGWIPQFKTAEDFLDATDKLLYKSKQGGRNRVSSSLVDGI